MDLLFHHPVPVFDEELVVFLLGLVEVDFCFSTLVIVSATICNIHTNLLDIGDLEFHADTQEDVVYLVVLVVLG